MSEVIPEIIMASGAVGGAGWGLRRLLGPAMTSVGKVFGTYAEYQAENLLKIDEKIQRRLEGEDAEKPTDQHVHPRVIKAALDEGSWISDDLHQEYIAGLLVGARTTDAKSDAKAYLARVVTNLTAEQVQLHYLVISAYAGYWDGKGNLPFRLGQSEDHRQHAVCIDAAEAFGRFPNFEASCKGLVREGIFQTFGSPPEVTGMNDTHKAFITTSFAFDLYREVVLPEQLSVAALLLTREQVDQIAAQQGAVVARPVPEPYPLTTAFIHNLDKPLVATD